jgi:hypothetical protein
LYALLSDANFTYWTSIIYYMWTYIVIWNKWKCEIWSVRCYRTEKTNVFLIFSWLIDVAPRMNIASSEEHSKFVTNSRSFTVLISVSKSLDFIIWKYMFIKCAIIGFLKRPCGHRRRGSFLFKNSSEIYRNVNLSRSLKPMCFFYRL